MSVASVELSGELYELSRWCPSTRCNGMHNTKFPPQYDLGYLLRKLPDTIRSRGHGFWYRWQLTPLGPGYNISYQNHPWVRDHKSALKRDGFEDEYIENLPYWQPPHYADEAADVVAKLAIELFEQGILTKEAGDVR